MGLMSNYIQSQINITSSEIVLDIFFQARPIVFPTDQLSCLINAKIPCKRMIVLTIYHLGANDF